jgi:hypothetical protein
MAPFHDVLSLTGLRGSKPACEREPTSTIMMISPVEMDKGYGPGSSRIGIDNSPWLLGLFHKTLLIQTQRLFLRAHLAALS